AATILKYLSEKRRDETRLEVERIRSETRLMCADAKARKAAEVAQKGEEEYEWTAADRALAEEVQRRGERYYAEKLAREQAIVYRWGGCHKIGDTPRDETDTPMRLYADMTAIRGQTIYWAVTDPPPVSDGQNGPFLPPPGCRPRTCPEPINTTAPPG